jgi:phosphohistidine phosphatase SixA
MLTRRRVSQLALLGWLLVIGCDEPTITVYVVRHAEKAQPAADADPDSAKDPSLTPLGKARADALPAALGDTRLTAIFSTPYKRTLETVAPIARREGVEVQTVEAADVAGLVERIRALGAGSSALVSGHSNTVPQIIEALGVGEKVELGEDDHGDLFVVTLTRSEARLERRRFDP